MPAGAVGGGPARAGRRGRARCRGRAARTARAREPAHAPPDGRGAAGSGAAARSWNRRWCARARRTPAVARRRLPASAPTPPARDAAGPAAALAGAARVPARRCRLRAAHRRPRAAREPACSRCAGSRACTAWCCRVPDPAAAAGRSLRQASPRSCAPRCPALELEFDIALGNAADLATASCSPRRRTGALPDVPEHFDVSLAMALAGDVDLAQLDAILALMPDVSDLARRRCRAASRRCATAPRSSPRAGWSASSSARWTVCPRLDALARARRARSATATVRAARRRASHRGRPARPARQTSSSWSTRRRRGIERHRHPDLAYASERALLRRAKHQAQLVEDEFASLQDRFVLDKRAVRRRELLQLIDRLGGAGGRAPDVVDADYFHARRQFMEFSTVRSRARRRRAAALARPAGTRAALSRAVRQQHRVPARARRRLPGPAHRLGGARVGRGLRHRARRGARLRGAGRRARWPTSARSARPWWTISTSCAPAPRRCSGCSGSSAPSWRRRPAARAASPTPARRCRSSLDVARRSSGTSSAHRDGHARRRCCRASPGRERQTRPSAALVAARERIDLHLELRRGQPRERRRHAPSGCGHREPPSAAEERLDHRRDRGPSADCLSGAPAP